MHGRFFSYLPSVLNYQVIAQGVLDYGIYLDVFHGDVSKKSPEIPCNNYRFIFWACVFDYSMDADASIYPRSTGIEWAMTL
jgi:hypothetical protein